MAAVLLLLPVGTRSEPALLYVEPDTQTLAMDYYGSFPEWKRVHAALCELPGLAAVLHVGDLVDAPRDLQYARAEEAFADRLDGCGIPLHAAVGNHDYDGYPDQLDSMTRWLAWRAARPSRPAAAERGEQTFLSPLVGNWWVASIPFRWTADDRRWLSDRIGALDPGQYVLFLQHACASRSGLLGDACRDFVDAHPQIQVVVSGHWLGRDREAFLRTALPSGRDVISIYVNYQHLKDTPVARWGALLTLDWEGGALEVTPFDPVSGERSFSADRHWQHDDTFIEASDPPARFDIPRP